MDPDGVPFDSGIPISVTFSVLDDLSSLCSASSGNDEPPNLSSSLTFGDIPIILFGSHDSESKDLGLDGSEEDTAVPLPPRVDRSDSVLSIATITTIGTFGPRRNAHRPPPLNDFQRESYSSFAASLGSTSSPPESPAASSDTSSISELSVASWHTALSATNSQSSISSYLSADSYGERFRTHQDAASINVHPSHLNFSPSPSPLSATFPAMALDSSSMLSSFSRNSSRSPSPVYDSDGHSLTTLDSPVRRLAKATLRPESRSSSHSSLLSIESISKPERPRGNPNLRLPQALSWLYNMSIGLLIDQEGFRSINPILKFVGYSSTSQSLDQMDAEGGGVAQFMPQKREAFSFHYALFDAMPILRRVTVNGKESRDYISRQATLNLKANGVYTIRGAETLYTKKKGHDSATKLRWKFDYMVDDRKDRATGQIMDGEKTLTPLTFSCSPLLLHPDQGKKIRLMHVMKKSVVAKLVAEKVEPPSGRSAPMLQTTSLPPPSPSKNNAGISRVWNNLHRRTQSQTTEPVRKHERTSSRSSTRSEFVFPVLANVDNHFATWGPKHQRAMSAGGSADV